MTVLGSGVTVDGLLADHSDTDTYTVELRAGEAYDFWVAGADSPAGLLSPVPTLQDPLLTITGPGGFPELGDDDSGEGRNAAFRFVASTPGTYTITVGESDNTPGGTGGSYVLNLTDASLDTDIGNHIFTPGALPGTDMILSQDDVLLSEIDRAGESDVVAVFLTGGTAYSFQLDSAGDLADPFLRLLDGNGVQVASDDNSGGVSNALIATFTPGASGFYYLVAQDDSGDTGSYELSFSSATPVDVPATIASTNNLPLGGTILGDIEINADQDWYAVRLVAGQQYRFNLDSNGLPDPLLFLRDGTGIPVIANDNSGGFPNAQLDYTPTVSGLYFLDAHNNGAGTGQYALSATLLSTPTAPVHGITGLDGTSYLGSDLTNSITGGGSADSIDGAPGNDTLAGGLGGDGVLGGAGEDSLDGGTGNDTVSGGTGNDTANGGGDADTVNGNDGNDTLDGGTGADSLTGGNDDDSVDGGDGNDTLDGGTGANQLNGGNDDDTFDNVLAGTTVSGGDGTDTVNTAIDFFLLAADVENLTLQGTANINAVGNGNDNDIQGNIGNNSLTGGIGADTIDGGGGNDFIGGGSEAGDGDDEGGDLFHGDAGNDTLDGDDGGDTLDGGADNDTVRGDDGNNSLDGAGGADSLDGGADDDTVNGGTGDDTISGGAGANQLNGNDGSDIFNVDSDSDTVNGGADTDLVNSSASFFALAGDVENLTLVGGGSIDGNGNGLANTIQGNTGDNGVEAGGGNDTVTGGLGDDTLDGDAGNSLNGGDDNDSLDGGSENDTAIGGLGNDTLDGDASTDSLSGGDGNDSLDGGSENDTLDGGLGNDTLDGGDGTNVMNGGDGNDTFDNIDGGDNVTAGAGVDQVNSFVAWTLDADEENLTLLGANFLNGNGNGGANVIFGNNGNNTLQGLGGADTVSGGAGADTLIGGAGKDLNTGGAGLDVIKYNALSDSGTTFATRDAINTFAHGDKIDLSAIDAKTTVAGNQAFTFVANFTHQAGQVQFDQVAINSFLITADVNGDAVSDFSLNVYTSPGFGTFHAFDFIL